MTFSHDNKVFEEAQSAVALYLQGKGAEQKQSSLIELFKRLAALIGKLVHMHNTTHSQVLMDLLMVCTHGQPYLRHLATQETWTKYCMS